MTITSAYREYVKTQVVEGERSFSMSSFKRHRPSYLKLLKCIPDMGCQCDICLNCSLKADSLIANKIKGISKRMSVNIFRTLCNSKNKDLDSAVIMDFRLKCIKRRCAFCFAGRMKEHILQENPDVQWDKPASFSEWQNIEVEKTKVDGVKNKKKKKNFQHESR